MAAEVQVPKNKLYRARIAQQKLEMERDIEVRDRFKLFAWGLQFREALLRRKYFIEAVNEVKRRLRKVLYMWQDKRAEDNFKELALMIENYDKDDPYY